MSVLRTEFLATINIGSLVGTLTDLALIERQLNKISVENNSSCCGIEANWAHVKLNSDSQNDFDIIESPEIARRDIANDEIRPSQVSFDSPESSSRFVFNHFSGKESISPINGDSSLFMMNDAIDFNTSSAQSSPNESDDLLRYSILDLKPLEHNLKIATETNKKIDCASKHDSYIQATTAAKKIYQNTYELFNMEVIDDALDNNHDDPDNYRDYENQDDYEGHETHGNNENDHDDDKNKKSSENKKNISSNTNEERNDAQHEYISCNSLKFKKKVAKHRTITTNTSLIACDIYNDLIERLRVRIVAFVPLLKNKITHVICRTKSDIWLLPIPVVLVWELSTHLLRYYIYHMHTL
jgi:hypothetical protein